MEPIEDLSKIFPLDTYVGATAQINGGDRHCRHLSWDIDTVRKYAEYGKINCSKCGAQLTIEVAQ